ncbi:hypothetical protein ACIRF8_04385 [Streptomyces sp. NPDC102406]|uniref:hypothetical protein n=1 Tax=Streptomyces sp. NPDC102406 TaxID=3366171 RepID=UPI00380F60F8
MWYAHRPGRRARQIIGDGAAVLWIALWAGAAVSAHRLITHAARSARPRIPLLGPRMHGTLHDVARAGDRLADSGPAPAQSLAVLAAVALFVVPVGLLLALWLPRRIRWTRQAAAARELAATEDGRELLALRALVRPLDELARFTDAGPGRLAEGWREADPVVLDALADVELRHLGLSTQRS